MGIDLKVLPLALSSLGIVPYQAPERKEVSGSLTFEDGQIGAALGDERPREGEQGWERVSQRCQQC